MEGEQVADKPKLNRRKLLLGTGLATVGLTAVGGTVAVRRLGIPMPEFVSGSEQVPDLTGKSVLITGSSSGFGRAGAEHYARLGAKVFATMRNLPRPEATQLADLAKREDLDIHIIEIDVTDAELVASGVAQALDIAGHIDVLINNAAIAVGGPLEAQDMEATRLMFETNVFGVQQVTQALLPSMRASGGGHIFNMSSMLGRLIVKGYGHYSPTKFALEAFSEQMAYEMEGTGVGVTIIQPGGYPTNIWKNQIVYTSALKERMPQDMTSVYPKLTEAMGKIPEGAGGDTDPFDIPRAIAHVLAQEPEDRPLRVEVHPVMRPQMHINRAAASQQALLATFAG